MKLNPLPLKPARLAFGLVAFVAAFVPYKPARAQAHSFTSRLGISVGTAWTVGSLGNPDMGLNERTVNAFALGVLPTYRVNHSLLMGLGFDSFWTGQITSVESAGGTNLKGQGYLAGIGARYFISEKWALQGNLNFVGTYNLTQDTHAGEDDSINRPLGIRLKGQYFFSRLPLTLDAVTEYIRWSRLTVTSTDLDKVSNQWMVGVGLTYHFGDRGGAKPAKESIATAPPLPPAPQATPVPASPDMETQLAAVMEVTQTDQGSMVNLSGDVAFASSSAELSPSAIEVLGKIADIIAKGAKRTIRIEGHSDSSGQKAKNQTLSQARANAVRDVFIQRGLNPDAITAVGMGQSKPLVSNATPAGRAKNRRVEIYVQDEKE